jgi:hypothetical protein
MDRNALAGKTYILLTVYLSVKITGIFAVPIRFGNSIRVSAVYRSVAFVGSKAGRVPRRPRRLGWVVRICNFLLACAGRLLVWSEVSTASPPWSVAGAAAELGNNAGRRIGRDLDHPRGKEPIDTRHYSRRTPQRRQFLASTRLAPPQASALLQARPDVGRSLPPMLLLLG